MLGITRFTCSLFELKLTKNVQRNILLSYVLLLLLSPRVCTPLKTSALTIYISRLLNTPFNSLPHSWKFCFAGTLLFIITVISKRIIYLTTRRKMVIFILYKPVITLILIAGWMPCVWQINNFASVFLFRYVVKQKSFHPKKMLLFGTVLTEPPKYPCPDNVLLIYLSFTELRV